MQSHGHHSRPCTVLVGQKTKLIGTRHNSTKVALPSSYPLYRPHCGACRKDLLQGYSYEEVGMGDKVFPLPHPNSVDPTASWYTTLILIHTYTVSHHNTVFTPGVGSLMTVVMRWVVEGYHRQPAMGWDGTQLHPLANNPASNSVSESVKDRVALLLPRHLPLELRLWYAPSFLFPLSHINHFVVGTGVVSIQKLLLLKVGCKHC